MIQANSSPERGVRVCVSAAGERNQRGEFGVAEPRERAAEVLKYERKHQARAGVMRTQSREHENSSADDRADSQGRE